MNITRVLTEYMENPIGLDIKSPRIMWNLEGVKEQSAFEVEYCVNDTMRSSGVIKSASMHYDFKEEFRSRDHIRFTIKTLCDGDWICSEEHFFEMGLLEKEDWKAQWISGAYKVNKKERYPVDCFRKTFVVTNVKKARLYISACGLYEASINGKRVGEFVLAPGSTDYRKRVQYQTYDVTELLEKGENELRIELADGWYRGSIGAKGFITDTVKYYGTFEAQAHGKAEGILVKMTCYFAEYTGELKADSEIAEIVWLTSADMDKISPVDQLIFADLKAAGLLS